MNIAILGFDRQGRSAYDYWNKPDNKITICDKDVNIKVPLGADAQLGDDYLSGLERFDLLIRTPGLHPRLIEESGGSSALNKVTTVTNEFLRVCPTKNVIGVTGTKGKGTTSTLIAKMLEKNNFRVHLGGNIGIAPLELLKRDIQPSDWVVLELANFQLIDLKLSPHIGVCLMVEPEHLDWHKDAEEYFEAKRQLFAHQTKEDIAIYFFENQISRSIASGGNAQLIPYYASPGAFIKERALYIDGTCVCKTDEFALLGEHNWQNICAAVTCVWQIKQDLAPIKEVLTSFTGLPFRLQFIAEKNGVRYYNDSFSSQPAATMAAIRAIRGQKVLIVGGKDRGLDLTHLASTIADDAENFRKIIIIGESAARLADTLTQSGFSNFLITGDKDMDQVVKRASSYAEAGDTIILSPGFPSFDMFKNFEERGELFNSAVDGL